MAPNNIALCFTDKSLQLIVQAFSKHSKRKVLESIMVKILFIKAKC